MARQGDVIPRQLIERTAERHVHGFDAQIGERLGTIGQHHVVMPALTGKGANQLPRIRRRPAGDPDERADGDAFAHPRPAGAPTAAGDTPAAHPTPASAPRASARTTSMRPRSAYPTMLATTIAAYVGK